jgi:Fe2+ transport system protein FeoA
MLLAIRLHFRPIVFAGVPMSTEKEIHQTRRPSGSPTEAGACPLDRVPECRWAEVVEVSRDHGANRRLAHLGIQVGAKVHVLRAAPLGGPILVEVHGGTVAVGRALARKVLVRMKP